MAGFQSLGINLRLKRFARPFKLQPTSGARPFFSFRPRDSAKKTKSGLIRICPDWFYTSSDVFGKDISTKLLYGMDPDGKSQNFILCNTFFDHIPNIQIREYQQDSRLNQVFSLLGNLVDGFQAGKSEDEKSNALFSLIGLAWKIFQKIITDPSQIIDGLKKSLVTNRNFKINESAFTEKYTISLIKFPHVFYYQLLKSETLAYYTLPYNGSIVQSANGDVGWNNGHKGGIQGGDGMLGGLANFIGVKQMNVTTTPTWDGVENSESTQIEFTLDLFNDSIEAACQNFVFINTILPAAMYTQYHIFQQSPSLFDIKVDGLGRFFMCTGNFKVEFKGVARTPSEIVFNELATKYLDKKYTMSAADLRQTGIVKIPDAYHVTLTFKSLLPNNFNNFIYSVCCSDSMTSLGVLPSLWSNVEKNMMEVFGNLKKEAINDVKEEVAKKQSNGKMTAAQYEANNYDLVKNQKGELEYKITEIEVDDVL